jgi:hypothetical protein
MKFRLSDHAQQELERRKIPMPLVEEVLERPQQVIPERAGKRAYQSKQSIGGKMFLVRVIVDDTVDPAVVVTVYRTTKIEKYWRTP